VSFAKRYSRIFDEVFGYDEGIAEESFVHPVREEEPARGDDYLVARGDSLLDDGEEACLKSALPGVSDEAWTSFVRCMATAPHDAVSDANTLGMFEMTPRRLEDLGIVKKLKRGKKSGKTVWLAVFVPPMTCDGFLKSPEAQRKVFARSMQDYTKKMSAGEIKKDPAMSTSGALAILHKAGPGGLKMWASGDRFKATQEAYDRVSGLF
jgi:hypothetical protein